MTRNTAPLHPATADDLSPAAVLRNNSAGQPIVFVLGGSDMEHIQNTKLWVIGSNGSNHTTYVYDPVTNKWTAQAPPVSGPSAAAPISARQSHILAVYGSGALNKPGPSQLYTP